MLFEAASLSARRSICAARHRARHRRRRCRWPRDRRLVFCASLRRHSGSSSSSPSTASPCTTSGGSRSSASGPSSSSTRWRFRRSTPSGAAWRSSARWRSTSIVFYFFVNVRDHQDVYVGWRVGHFLFMSAAVVIGVLLEYVHARPSARGSRCTGRRSRSPSLPACRPAIIDIYNTQDITNHGEMPAGHWTLMLRPDDLQIFDWIRHNTRPEGDRSRSIRSPAIRESLGVSAGVRRAAHGDRPADLDGAAREVSAGRPKRFDLIYEEQPLARLRARRPRAGELRADRTAGARGASGRRGSIQCDLRIRLPLVFKNGTISIYEVQSSASLPAGTLRLTSCRTPSGASRAAAPSDRGSALKVPTNIVLNAMPFHPL